MKLIIEYARSEGLHYVCGQVLREFFATRRRKTLPELRLPVDETDF